MLKLSKLTQHAQALKVQEIEVSDLISRLKTKHGGEVHEQLVVAAMGLQKAHKDHTEAFGKRKAEHKTG